MPAISAATDAGYVRVHGVDHGHGIVPVPERGHDHGRDHVHGHDHGNVHVTGFDRPFLVRMK
jgi:hypothetical protein